MKGVAAPILLMFFVLCIFPFCSHAQEENNAVIKQGTRYVSLKMKGLDKYNSRLERQQDRLLKKLKKKETHFAHHLKATDSAGYARYAQQSGPSFDSISKLSKGDTGATAAQFSKKKNVFTDSLQKVTSFISQHSGLATNVPVTGVAGQSAEMSQLQGQLNYRAYITQLITQRTNTLNTLGGTSNVPGLTGIQQQVYYAKAKMKVFTDMEEDPSKAEDQAMEYLQGTAGFDKAMSSGTGGAGSMAGLTDASQLQDMGFQTKQMMQSSLQNKFGAGLGAVANQVSGEITQWQNRENAIASNLKQAKQSIHGLGDINAPSFKVNPMRGLPFWKRIQKQYSWQTTRASADETQPAIMQPSAMFGFKQSPKLVYGAGIATSIGLGQGWQNLHFSFQGIGLRSFINWAWQYGFGVYAGYERMYNGFAFTKSAGQFANDVPTSVHSNADYTESVLIGLTKNYNINTKYSGQLQLLYDIWWQEKGLRGPFILRFATISK